MWSKVFPHYMYILVEIKDERTAEGVLSWEVSSHWTGLTTQLAEVLLNMYFLLLGTASKIPNITDLTSSLIYAAFQ